MVSRDKKQRVQKQRIYKDLMPFRSLATRRTRSQLFKSDRSTMWASNCISKSRFPQSQLHKFQNGSKPWCWFANEAQPYRKVAAFAVLNYEIVLKNTNARKRIFKTIWQNPKTINSKWKFNGFKNTEDFCEEVSWKDT